MTGVSKMASASLRPDRFPAPWASAWGLDRYGYWQAFEVEGVHQVMRWIPPGRFMMGSPDSELGRFPNEVRHPVRLTEGFWLGDTACTQGLWKAIMKKNPSLKGEGDNFPVENVSWNDCQLFFEKLQLILPSLILGLPSEAQWEYACRAGGQNAFAWGNSLSPTQARYDYEKPYDRGKKAKPIPGTAEVMSYSPNAWGLYQMHGNVWEWCSDWFAAYDLESPTDPVGPLAGRFRVLRGGCWINSGRFLRSAGRGVGAPDDRSNLIGFRLAGGRALSSQ